MFGVVATVVVSLGGLAAIAAGAWKLVNKLVGHRLALSLEREKSKLAAIGQFNREKVEHLRALWESMSNYGKNVVALGRGRRDGTFAVAADDYSRALARTGVFLNPDVREAIERAIGRAFIQNMLSAPPHESSTLVAQFERDLLPTALRAIEAEMKQLTGAPRAAP